MNYFYLIYIAANGQLAEYKAGLYYKFAFRTRNNLIFIKK